MRKLSLITLISAALLISACGDHNDQARTGGRKPQEQQADNAGNQATGERSDGEPAKPASESPDATDQATNAGTSDSPDQTPEGSQSNEAPEADSTADADNASNNDTASEAARDKPKHSKLEELKTRLEKDETASTRLTSQSEPLSANDNQAANHTAGASDARQHHRPERPVSRETYADIDANDIKRATEKPVSTFSVDVDTGAYANVRRFLNDGQLPPRDAVRTEELINYFDYDYSVPEDRDRPFSVSTDVAPSPWNADKHLLRVGIQGWEPTGEAQPANLVFLIDVSGSMGSQDKLPLLKSAMQLLTERLDREDWVSIVVYSGAARVALEPTSGDRHSRIKRAIERLEAGGSTNGGDGIRQAYELANQAFIEEGVNRVLLASDGDFNVGTVNHDALVDLVEHHRESGIALTSLGFGKGNYDDRLVEQLANKGNGNHAYIDNLTEARRVLVENYAATMQTIAKDVKIQIEFNPAVVAEYRLVGYENRQLEREDFNNDNVDAGEIGAGHTVTALYEIALKGSSVKSPEPLRYGSGRRPVTDRRNELAFLRLRHKAPGGEDSRLMERPIRRAAMADSLAEADRDLRFAAAVAGYGQLLRGGEHTGDFGYADVVDLARRARGDDPDGRRSQFVQLVELTQSLDNGVARESRESQTEH